MIIILLPVYNEERAINSLLTKIDTLAGRKDSKIKVLIVDDGSSDQSISQIKKFNPLNIKIILKQHPINYGLGMAIRTGIFEALSIMSDDDILITMDADDTHSPDIIPLLEEKIAWGADVAIASRFVPGGEQLGVPGYRKWISRIANRIIRFFLKTDIRDFTCGFRAYSYSILIKLWQKYGDNIVEEKGFSCQMEIFLKLKSLGAKIVEIPFSLRYDLKKAPSKMKILQTTKDTLKLLLKHWIKG